MRDVGVGYTAPIIKGSKTNLLAAMAKKKRQEKSSASSPSSFLSEQSQENSNLPNPTVGGCSGNISSALAEGEQVKKEEKKEGKGEK